MKLVALLYDKSSDEIIYADNQSTVLKILYDVRDFRILRILGRSTLD